MIVTYTQVWSIIWIDSSCPTDFHSEKIGLIKVTYGLPVSIRVNEYLKSLLLSISLSFFSLSHSLSLFSFRSDGIELDFKEISYLVFKS